MFTPDQREALLASLVAAARTDSRISGAALTGSASTGTQDRWSDIDLMVGLTPAADRPAVLADWTGVMYREHGAVHHLDVVAGAVIYRVFLLASTLQVDIAFAGPADFGPIAPTFALLFGTAAQRPQRLPPAAAELAGMGWLHALHARSSLARGRVWQAEYMISAVRDHALALACLRLGLPAYQGRGLDQLPAEAAAGAAMALVRSLEPAELRRALGAAVAALADEIRAADAGLAERLAGPLAELAAPVKD